MSSPQGQILDKHNPLIGVSPRTSEGAVLTGGGGRWDHPEGMSTSSQFPADMLLPPLSSRQYSHLPTPQSPRNLGQYMNAGPYTPESPVPHGPHMLYPPLATSSFGHKLTSQRFDHTPQPSLLKPQQIMTPDSSPFAPRISSPRSNDNRNQTTSRINSAPFAEAPRSMSSDTKLEPFTGLAPAHRIASPMSTSSEPVPRSHLSSPFMAKLSLSDRGSVKSKTPALSRPTSPHPEHVSDLFSERLMVMSTPPLSPPPLPEAPGAGGEMERLRLQMMHDKMAHFQDAESRRPEYLKRAKRTLLEADPSFTDGPDMTERDSGLPGVGITVSPNKGRRLKLFQETSEESFEESLMAGGYGRYRTSDWLQQPQPTPGPAGPSSVVSILEAAAPPSERELKKQKRLLAFREPRSNTGTSKLVAVELAGTGRVLLDVTADDPPVPEPPVIKKRGGNRRKKRGAAAGLTVREKILEARRAAEIERPNWPDSEFPWRLRSEEQAAVAKVEAEERLKWIEKFLDRDTDDEDEADEDVTPSSARDPADDDDDDIPLLVKLGRGKTAPLHAKPDYTTGSKRKSSVLAPNDPADARAALLSKKSVRTLSYRQKRRRNNKDEIVCICRGRDDGRELVQCDGCRTWYHLQCIGIRDISDLGREEDPWYCNNCVNRTPSPDPIPSSEPTFVPTDDGPRRSFDPPYDPPFFQTSLQESPLTPLPSPTSPIWSAADPGSGSTSGSSWSRSNGPATPHRSSHAARVYHTPNNNPAEEFDPTSTPSRGIKFGGAQFTTPKNNLWSTRANGLFQTPKLGKAPGPGTGSAGRVIGAGDDSGGSLPFTPLRTLPSYDESPIRRVKPGERYLLESPLLPGPHVLSGEGPVARSTGQGPAGSTANGI